MASTYEQFNQENKAICIYHGDSHFDSYFRMISPFAVTLKHCSGIESDDYMNIVILSPDYAYYNCATYGVRESYFNTRPLHRHSYFELVLVLKGTIRQRMEDTDIICPEGSCYILNKNLRHAEYFTEEATVLLIGLPIEFLEDLLFEDQKTYYKSEKELLSHPMLQFFNTEDDRTCNKSYLQFLPKENQSDQLLKKLWNTTDMLTQALLYPKLGSTHITKGLIGTLLQDLLTDSKYNLAKIDIDSSPEFILFSRVTYLLEQTDGIISRAELEKQLHYSGNYMNRVVKKYTQACLFEYCMHFRMKKAATLLLHTDQSISDIALSLDFKNRSHFYRWFKKKYHMTPKEYRLLHAKEIS